jgi:hypothetical protein
MHAVFFIIFALGLESARFIILSIIGGRKEEIILLRY